MDHMILFLLVLVVGSVLNPVLVLARPPKPTSEITVMGVVYCDICSNNTFSRHSYFMQGVDVHVQCKFNAKSPRTAEQISFTVNRTTDRFGVYKLQIPSVDGINCSESATIESFCEATLLTTSHPICNVPGLKTTSEQIAIKSKQANLCIYSLNALNYRPSNRDTTLCGLKTQESYINSLNSSKFFLPCFPPYGFPWAPFPTFPFPFPSLPPFPSFPFPPLPPLPSLPPLPTLPPLPPLPPSPFPFPPIPPLPTTPPAPGFNLGDPKTWVPSVPKPSPPAFNLGDPRTWVPNVPPLFSPPSPPAFDFRDPRTWVPSFPPSPPHNTENQQKP